jgi:hypothetical protein
MKESALQASAINLIEARGGFVVNQWGSPLTQRGVPDLLVCYLGRFIAFELKNPELPLDDFIDASNDRFATPAQVRKLNAIRAAKGIGLVCNDLATIERVLIAVEAGYYAKERS